MKKTRFIADHFDYCVCDERIAEIPSDHKIQISYRRKERTVGIAKHGIIYRVTKDGNPAEITVHLGRMKKYVVPLSSPVPDLDALDDIFLETTLHVPELESSLSKVMIGAFTVESIDGHQNGVGAAYLTNFLYHLKLEG